MSSNRRVWYRQPDGSASTSDDLVETERGWVRPSPIHCPNGHPFRPGRTVVNWCACHSNDPDTRCDGHIAHTCLICHGAIYRPAIQPSCELVAFDGRSGKPEVPGG